MKLSLVFALTGLMCPSLNAEQVLNAFGEPSYGVDVSFPVHYGNLLDKNDPNQPLGDRQALYDEYMKGCHDFYGKRATSCDVTEEDRWDMSLRQPTSMQVRGFASSFHLNFSSVLTKKVLHDCRTTPILASRKFVLL